MSTEEFTQQGETTRSPEALSAIRSGDAGGLLDDIMDGKLNDTESTISQEAPEGVSERSEEPGTPTTEIEETVNDGDLTPPESIESVDPTPPTDVLKQEEPAAKPESTEDNIPDPPEIQGNPKAAKAWTHLKRENKEQAQRIKDLEARIDASEDSKPADPEEMTELKTRLAEAEDRLGQLDITQTASFKQRYQVPIQTLFNKGKGLLMKAGHGEAEAHTMMLQLAKVDNSIDAIQDIVADEPIALQGALTQMASDLGDLQKTQAEAVTNWKDTRSAMAEEEERIATATFNEALTRDVGTALETLREEGSWAFLESETDQDWNESVQERIRATRGLLRDAKPEEMAKYMLDGIAAPFYRKMYESQLADYRKVKDELDRRVGAMPGVAARQSAAQPQDTGATGPVSADEFLDQYF